MSLTTDELAALLTDDERRAARKGGRVQGGLSRRAVRARLRRRASERNLSEEVTHRQARRVYESIRHGRVSEYAGGPEGEGGSAAPPSSEGIASGSAERRSEDVGRQSPGGAGADDSGDLWTFEKGYSYNGATDTYIFDLRCHPSAPYPVAGSVIRDLVHAYSDYDGEGATINEVATRFRLPRQGVKEIKSALGMTHDSPPRTPEEILEGDAEALVEEDLQTKRLRYARHLQAEDWKATKRDAERWRERHAAFEKMTRELFSEHPFPAASPAARAGAVPLESAEGPRGALLVNAQDWHLGKRTRSAESLEAQKEGLVGAFVQLVLKAARQAALERVLLVVGGDLVHVDSEGGATTSGTSVETNTSAAEAVQAGLDLILMLVGAVRKLIPEAAVELAWCRGNHDALASSLIYHAVRRHYEEEEAVRVREQQRPYAFLSYGKHLFFVLHGDASKKQMKKIGNVILAEAPREMLAETEYVSVHSGHRHHELVVDDQGVLRRQAPSPAGTDAWHERNLLVGSRRHAQGLLYHPETSGDTVFNVEVG